jgi:hypothetical protein
VSRKDVADWAFELVAASENVRALRVLWPCERKADDGSACWTWGQDEGSDDTEWCDPCRTRYARRGFVRVAKEQRRMALRGLFRAVRRMRDGK